MTTTEKLQKYLNELEERKIALFFDMQNTTSTLNGRMYTYHIVVGLSALFVFFIGYTSHGKDTMLIRWSNFVAVITLFIALLQYLSILDNISKTLYKNICSIYKKYDDEYYILKKFNAGKIKEDLIRQFYINKTKDMTRYECQITQPNWFAWISTSLLIVAIILLLLA